MGYYVPNTEKEQKEMLKAIGMESFDELFHQIPEQVRIKKDLGIPQGVSEMEVATRMQEIADKNIVFKHIFRGAGAYHHYIPAIVKSVVSKEEFVTAYTPYQAEISQGILQSIFEFQTMICELTGMDASNASVYDGASAAAEAVAMCRDRKRNTAYISETTDPKILSTIKTYCYGNGMEVSIVPQKDGETDLNALETALSDNAACVYLQQPNYFGIIENATAIGEITHAAGARYIMGCNPTSLAILKTPGECNADVAVGEGQPLGLPMAFGGPYLGYMAAKADMVRKLPGRIVGETIDLDGKRSYVLTLQAREQHIRREKAGSNICSNQTHCALTASVYMAALGKDGLTEVAKQCMSKAHFLQKGLEAIGLPLKYNKKFFHEFVTVSDTDTGIILQKLEEKGYLGGLPLNKKEILWCVTECNTRGEIEELVELVKEVQER